MKMGWGDRRAHCFKMWMFAPDLHFSGWSERVSLPSISHLTYHWVLHCGIITCLPVPLSVCVCVGIKTGSLKRDFDVQGSFSHSPSADVVLPFYFLLFITFISYLSSQAFSPFCRFLALSPSVCLHHSLSLPILVIATFSIADRANLSDIPQ